VGSGAKSRENWGVFVGFLKSTNSALYAVERPLAVRILQSCLAEFSGAGREQTRKETETKATILDGLILAEVEQLFLIDAWSGWRTGNFVQKVLAGLLVESAHFAQFCILVLTPTHSSVRCS